MAKKKRNRLIEVRMNEKVVKKVVPVMEMPAEMAEFMEIAFGEETEYDPEAVASIKKAFASDKWISVDELRARGEM